MVKCVCVYVMWCDVVIMDFWDIKNKYYVSICIMLFMWGSGLGNVYFIYVILFNLNIFWFLFIYLYINKN